MEEEESPEKKVEEELNDTCSDLDNQCQTQSVVLPVGEVITGH